MSTLRSPVGTSAPAMGRLVGSLRRLPGIGEKSATRLAYFLLGAPEDLVRELSEAVGRIQDETAICERCFNLAESSPCRLCPQPNRDASILCVVEEPADLAAIEESGSFNGLYHVLGGALSPIDGMGPDNLRMSELLQRVRSGDVREVILATNPNTEGDATAHYTAQQLAPTGVKLTRIACGMPLGGELEYADHVTVGRSLENRQPVG